MALSKLIFKPGLNLDQTNYSSEGGWFDCNNVRFRSGFPEKVGGWVVATQQPYAGVTRSLYSWITTDGGKQTAVGSNEKIYVNFGTSVKDITPIRATFTSPTTNNCFTTTSGTKSVSATIVGCGVGEGDYVIISGATGFAGIPAGDLNQEHKVSNVSGDTFEFTVATTATSTATGGGTGISTAFLMGVGRANIATGYGWGAGGWGSGAWGSGSVTPIFLPARNTYFQTFNNDLMFNIVNPNTGEEDNIYYWAYDSAYLTRAVRLSDIAGAVAVPQKVNKILFAFTGHLFALGCTNYNALGSAPDYLGTYDPLMIRWADVDADIGPRPEYWKPETTNSAGFLRIETGSRIVTAINSKQEMLVWTERSLTSIQFLGTSEVFGKQEVSANVTIAGPNVAAIANDVVYWMGFDKFYTYSGRVDTLPCTLRQYVFGNINKQKAPLFFAGTNAEFNEVIWFYCSAQATDIDRYVVFNYSDNIWYFGQINRTAWIDAGVNDKPIGASNTWLYKHETGTDDGQPNGQESLPINAYIQSADVDIDDGDRFMLVQRVIPDVNFSGSQFGSPITGAPYEPQATITVSVRNFPGARAATENVEGESTARGVKVVSALIDNYTNQVFVRARGRQIAFRIGSDNLGTQWQLGMARVDARPDGRKA